MRWAADLRYNVPEAGNYYPGEGGFLARSSKEQAVTDWREFLVRSTLAHNMATFPGIVR